MFLILLVIFYGSVNLTCSRYLLEASLSLGENRRYQTLSLICGLFLWTWITNSVISLSLWLHSDIAFASVTDIIWSVATPFKIFWQLITNGAHPKFDDRAYTFGMWIKLSFSSLRWMFAILFFTLWLLYNLHRKITDGLAYFLELKSGAFTVMAAFVAAAVETIHWLWF
jgi:hypothetical protein